LPARGGRELAATGAALEEVHPLLSSLRTLLGLQRQSFYSKQVRGKQLNLLGNFAQTLTDLVARLISMSPGHT
jgi:hypothetical protein